MPRYEYRCRSCASFGGAAVFEVSCPMSASGEPATCPEGHGDTVRLLSAVAVTGAASGPAPAGGGCCGGACGCG
ncbi:MAG TPA: FmdB family zinc ribbon protein [Pseudonocardia sp.]